MELKERIAEAFTRPDGTMWRPSEIAAATGKSKSAVTLWLKGEIRSLKGDTATAMEKATGYRAGWLVNGKGPKRVKDIAGTTSEGWPFPDISYDRWEALTEMQRGGIQQEVLKMIEAYEAKRSTGSGKSSRSGPGASPSKKAA